MAIATMYGGPLDGQEIAIPKTYDTLALITYLPDSKKYNVEFYELSSFEHPLKDDAVATYDYDGSSVFNEPPFERE